MKQFLKTLWRYKVSTLLNILGLAIALSAMYLILVQVNFDFSYNKGIKDSERIYIAGSRSWKDSTALQTWLSRPIAEESLGAVAQIEAFGTGDYGSSLTCSYKKNDNEIEIDIQNAQWSLGLFKVLGIEMVSGGYEELIEGKDVVISESFSQKTGLGTGDIILNKYGSKDPSKQNINIKGIFKDLPKVSIFSGLEMISNIGDNYLNDRQEWSFNYYMKLNDGVSEQDAAKAILDAQTAYLRSEFAKDSTADASSFNEALNHIKITPIPLNSSYFSKDEVPGLKGNKGTTVTLFAVAFLIIIIALINFINFFFALVPLRIKAVNTKKVFGCSLAKLRLGFIAESAGIVFIALLISYYIDFYVSNSAMAGYFTTSLGFSNNITVFAGTIIAAVIITLAGSLYPAYYITSFNTAFVLKGSFSSTKSGMVLRNLLIGIQFFISISLIICSIFVNLQHNYMLNYDMGFNKENMVSVYGSNSILDTPDKRTMLVNRFKENPSIVDAAFCDNNFIAQSRMGWGREFKGENIQLQVLPVSYNFVKMMGIRMLDGRYFTQDDELKETGIFIINEAAAKQYNITLEDQLYGHIGPAPVVGICEDFHFRPMQYETIPFAFYVMGTKPWRAQRHIYIRLAPGADIQSVKQHVCSVIKELAPNMRDEWMSFNSFDEELGSSYKKESRLSNLITIFSIISIIISLMGVFGLVMFETQYRKHEIGIRRVLGSSIGDILKMFNYKYLKIIAVCFVIAIPVTSYIINEWFKSFAYHTSLHWWVFAVALLIVLAITIVTVTLRSLSAATANPVESIKSE